MGSHYEAPIRKPLVTGNKSYHQISVDVARPIEGVANKKWWIVFGISLILFMWGIGCIARLSFVLINLVPMYAKSRSLI